jgi:putative membrane protein
MVAMAATGGASTGAGERNLALLFVAGVAASSAMILPGVSGGYLLLLLGQYEPILGTIDQLKRGLLGEAGPDLALVFDAMVLVVPLGLGVVAGVVGVSNLLRWLLHHYEKATLGALLGLLLGAVVGLWPYQEGRPPEPGALVKGSTVTAENQHLFDPDDWPLVRFEPSPGQVAGSLALVGAGLAATALLGRLGGDGDEA